MVNNMTKRKFYKTIITVEVLSEKPLQYSDLSHVHYEITDGHCSGIYSNDSPKILNGKQTAKALLKQGSDPEFFCLDKNGNDSEVP
jgi:hypothetical protein